MHRFRLACGWVVPALLSAGALHAQPSPLTGSDLAFPGSNPSPGSAISAGLAQADRWLGDEPFDNPAIVTGRGAMVAPVLLHVSRQDLRAANRDLTEESAFIDGSGAWVAAPVPGFRLAVYVHQPVLRRESNAFERGVSGGPVEPAVLQTDETVREIRGGLAVARRFGALTLGAAGEWSRRRDDYHRAETSGSPTAGNRSVTLQGDGVGGQAGVRVDLPRTALGEIALGAGARYLPALALDGTQALDLGTGTSRTALSGERRSGWEGGVSLADRVTSQVRLVAGAGARTAREWSGFEVTAGQAWSGSLAMEFHDPRDPWTIRLGLGREGEEGSATPHAGAVALGLGWSFGTTGVDVGVLRRSLESRQAPTSFDDRVVLSGTARF